MNKAVLEYGHVPSLTLGPWLLLPQAADLNPPNRDHVARKAQAVHTLSLYRVFAGLVSVLFRVFVLTIYIAV